MCFDKLLGLHECSLPEPTTGLYIDSLGINTTLLGQLITDQYNNGVELFEDKRAFAWRKLSGDVLTRLSPAMKADTVNMSIGNISKNAGNETTKTSGIVTRGNGAATKGTMARGPMA